MPVKNKPVDVLIIGASASGLMCAIEAGKRGRKVLVLDHANKAGKKILMSGGGRCNFTNMEINASNYISHNPHFCKSALSRYTQWDFIAKVLEYEIAYHERDLGKLFCDDSAKDILDLLLTECQKAKVEIRLNCAVESIQRVDQNKFKIQTSKGSFKSESLVVASGGLSIPKMCASPLGYKIAEQFGHKIWPTSPGLVPFTLHQQDKDKLSALTGIAIDCEVSTKQAQFNENILFTHRGLSGPAILQISSYWGAGETVLINLIPAIDVAEYLLNNQHKMNKQLKTVLAEYVPKRVVEVFVETSLLDTPLQNLSKNQIQQIGNQLNYWQIKPNATEGYRTAEVTLGGVDCDELSSKTMQSNKVEGLYFIGEIVDVTGWLGGYNFQWAWSSGWCAGQVV